MECAQHPNNILWLYMVFVCKQIPYTAKVCYLASLISISISISIIIHTIILILIREARGFWHCC